jgi:hypothetical protein
VPLKRYSSTLYAKRQRLGFVGVFSFLHPSAQRFVQILCKYRADEIGIASRLRLNGGRSDERFSQAIGQVGYQR